jgi:hypothetical protein
MALPASVHQLERDLRGVFGARLESLVAYGLDAHGPARTMALVTSVTEQDLRGCASHVSAWHAAGLATPLIVPRQEFERSLDAFPLEFAAIIASHAVVAGGRPFDRVTVKSSDLRRACEVAARSHLLHLREGCIEAGGNSHALAVLIVDSAAPLSALVTIVARLEGRVQIDAEAAGRHAEHALGVPGGAIAGIVALMNVHEIPAAEAERIFPPYLAAMERLVEYIDRWRD